MNQRDAMPSLSIEDVSSTYGTQSVLRAVHMHVPAGTLTCLVGASGAGKTTLLRIIAGLLQPHHGRVCLGDELWGRYGDGAVVHMPPQQRRVGFMFQNASLFPHITVLGNVCFGIRHMPKKQRYEMARMWLDNVGMGSKADAYAHQLSGGQHQRVALARALCAQPRVMLLDEPFASLDPSLRRDIRDEILALVRSAHMPMVMVTHDPEEALAVADQMVVLRGDGTIHQAGTPYQIYHHPVDAVCAEFFGSVVRMNGRVRGEHVYTSLGLLPKQLCAPSLSDGTELSVVARPEGIRCVYDGEQGVRVVVCHSRLTAQGWMVDAITPEGMRMMFHHRENAPLSSGDEVLVTLQLPYVYVFQNGL
ncbi:MAG: ABC transporter ATP-binding protein [Alphaproteobacteria bacterium]|nr:MAG: ABC transporter ATP-binding protein [Alphaproteobacteria bacterium]